MNRDRRKIETCPFDSGIPCRTSTLLRNLTRSIKARDRRPTHMRRIKYGGAWYYLPEKCEGCAYLPERVEPAEAVPVWGTVGAGMSTHAITLDAATVEGYRTLYEAAKAVHVEEVEGE